MTGFEPAIDAVIFDLDGVLIDSEPVWEEVRRAFVAEQGGRWLPDSQRRIMGMSTAEWSTYLHDDLGVAMLSSEIGSEVIGRMGRRYDEQLPLLDGAQDVVRRMAANWRLGLASSSPQRLIDLVLDRAGLAPLFAVAISTERVARGKPSPDIYLAVAERLGTAPARCVAVEDSSNGLRAASAAGMLVVAAPRPRYPPDPDALAGASLVISNLGELTVEAIARR